MCTNEDFDFRSSLKAKCVYCLALPPRVCHLPYSSLQRAIGARACESVLILCLTRCGYCILNRRLGASEPLDDAFRQRIPREPCDGVAVLSAFADGPGVLF